MKKFDRIVAILVFMALLAACTNKKKDRDDRQYEKVALKYAQGFTIEKGDGFEVLTVLNPWKENEVYDKYYLVKDTGTLVPQDGKKIKIPLKSMVANSATYLEFLNQLGELEKVTGVCSARYIYNPSVVERVGQGLTKDLGDAFNLDIESLMVLHPDAIMTSAYNAEDENSKKLTQCGIPVLFNIEWQEKTPLGRAEWIKFIGAFFDKQELAERLFGELEKRYNEARREAASAPNTPTVLSGQDFRGTWSMPGGQSFNARLYKDAGGNYLYAGNPETGSISTNIENALVDFNRADVWIGVQANTLEELGRTDAKYKLFDAFKKGNVYNYNNRMNATGGSDYWEGAVAHPDLLLKDLIKVFHPDLLPEYEFTYISKLK